ncbi:unnamed protein product [Rotaria sordida]|uniref:Ionotropic glutamate receptor C-terminal domain-containing protein n=1 Tax=Rotaria sordida TaxID=392033 RepID=A0A819QUX4_9BILA|nr:unnamed protein product [Rotaria sordida]CAF4034533.1 unnamed protein product [Rotaria sordida]
MHINIYERISLYSLHNSIVLLTGKSNDDVIVLELSMVTVTLYNSTISRTLCLFQDPENTSETTDLSVHSRAMFKAAVLLSQQYNITIEGQFIGWQAAQTGGNVTEALSETCQSVSTSNIIGIVGPAFSREAHIVAGFAERIGIPVISYAATDPDLSDRNAYPSFYRTVPSDNTAALAIVKLFIRFNWTSSIIIYQNDVFGSGGAKVISEVFIRNGIIVREMIVFDIVTRRIRGDLKKSLTSSATRIVVLWVQSTYTSLVLQNALDSDVVGPQFIWILSSSVPLDSFNQTFYQKLIGMLTIEPVTGKIVDAPINSTLLNAAYNIWKAYEPETFPVSMNVNYYSLFAFDATWSLIKSLEQLCSTPLNSSSSSCTSFTGSSFCFDRRIIHSDLLLKSISRIEFLGISGPVRFSVNVTDRINGSFYYAQNVQPSSNGVNFVPVLKYVDSDGWKAYTESDVIVWPGNSLVPPTGRAILKGVSLRIGVIKSPPFTMVTNVINGSGQNITKLIGYIPDLIEILQNKMGFIPIVQLAPSNQTYSELIQAVENGIYDIVIGDITVTAMRRERVDFSNAIFDNYLRIIMRKTSDVNIDLLSFLKPFSRNLWWLVLGACIYAGILLCLVERQDNEALQNRSIFSQVTMSVWYSFGNIVGYGVDFDVNTAAGRLITIGLYMLSLVLVASYTANLASDLTISKSKSIISGIDDLKSGKIPFNRIGILVGTAAEDYYLREISEGSRNYYPVESTEELYDSLLANIIDATFMDIGVAEYDTNNVYCNLTLVGEGFDKSVFGIVTSKEWLYAQDLDVNILSLRESGELDDLRIKWFQIKNCPDSSETSTAIGIESMGGLFLTFGVISVLSLLLFAWSKRHILINYLFILICRKKSSRKRKNSMRRHSIKTVERS